MAEPTAGAFAPNPGPQTAFVEADADVVVYGGAAGGGKTVGLLLDFARYADDPAARGVIFRRTYPQITSGGGLWDEAVSFFRRVYGRKLRANQSTLTLTFPAGGQLAFRHLQYEKNVYDWQGAQLTFVAFDESTHFSWKQISYLLSRLRTTSGLPTKMRLTCNPDAESWLASFLGWWIDQRTGYPRADRAGRALWMYVENDVPQFYADPAEARRRHPTLAAESPPLSVAFVPSSLDDTPQLAGTGYKGRLLAQTEIERERLLKGNWRITATDGLFKPHWFPVAEAPPAGLRRVRAWDLAATEPKDKDDPDWTVGTLLGADGEGRFYVLDVARDRLTPAGVRAMVRRMAEWDGQDVPVVVEQEGGSAGKAVVDDYVRLLAGWTVKGVKPTGDKVARANPVAAQAERGNVLLVRSPWNQAWLAEMARFPYGKHDDQCLPAGVPVLTSCGWVPVESVSVGDSVLTRGGWRPVVGSQMTRYSASTVVVGWDGGELECTPNHPVWTETRGWVPAGDLTTADELLSWRSWKRSSGAGEFGGATPSRRGGRTACTSSLTRHGRHRRCSCTGKSGSPHTGKSRRAIKSTTGTGIRSTTTCPIWSAFPARSTADCTASSTGPSGSCGTWSGFAARPPSGTGPTPVGLGTANTAGGWPSNWPTSGTNGSASSVGHPSSLGGRSPSIARPIASGPGRRSGFRPTADRANCAGPSTPSTAPAGGFAPAGVRFVRAGRRGVPVFNLAVDGWNEYVAAGALVHNCDSLSLAFAFLAGKPSLSQWADALWPARR